MRGGQAIAATAGAGLALLVVAAAANYGVQAASPSGPDSVGAWATGAIRPPGELPTGRGEELIQRHGCRLCHVIDGAGGSVGPDLAGVRRRKTRAEIIDWLDDPGRIKPDTIMPRFPLTPVDQQLLADHLLTR